MFAVPGWSVPAELLKTQKDVPASSNSEARSAKKRKRGRDDPKVTDSNVAEMWSEHIDGLKPTKKSKPEGGNTGEASHDGKGAKVARKHDDHAPEDSEKHTNKSSKKSLKKRKLSDAGDRTTEDAKSKDAPQGTKHSKAHESHAKTAVQADNALKLTPMQAAMRAKLMGARFRHLNETLYTKPSAESTKLFDDNPTFFEEYHSGFRQQVSSWPENPVDGFVAELKRRGKIRPQDQKHKKQHAEPTASAEEKQPRAQALPQSKGMCHVADLGCGDARIAKEVKVFAQKCHIHVQSFDLYSQDPLVTKADVANLPISAESVDVAIFCLALMGTNWIDFIEEAWRVLHWKGELWIAEIKSRFAKPRQRIVEHSVGKKKKPNKAELQRQKQQDEEAAKERLIAEVDEAPVKDTSTDVSAFVSVLRRRGFVLDNQQDIDLSNKMFVRMKFIKSAPPVKGRHASDNPTAGKKWRDLLREEDINAEEETTVLKPCLYKIR